MVGRAEVVLRGGDIEFKLPRSASKLSESLAAGGLAVITHVSPSADACFAWKPNEDSVAISLDGSKGNSISGCFMLLLRHGDADEVGRVEDGFSLMLCPETWEGLTEAISSCSPVQICGESFNFRLSWL